MDEASDCLTQARERLRLNDLDGAEALLRRALVHDSKRALAWELLAKLLYRASRLEEARALCGGWLQNLPGDPAAAHLLAAFGGSTAPDRASDAFIVRLFDRAAQDFDTTLASLGYQAPRLVFESALRAFQGNAGGIQVLDAGCGTGLCGEWIRPLARRLVGVDLSPGMIEQARQRGCYDELACAELTSYSASSLERFDLVMAADVLCYFGELDEPISALGRILQPGGFLVFSVEDLSAVRPDVGDSGYRLLEHGRYAHVARYVEAQVRSAGLELEAAEPGVLRYERGVPVRGLIVAARCRS